MQTYANYLQCSTFLSVCPAPDEKKKKKKENTKPAKYTQTDENLKLWAQSNHKVSSFTFQYRESVLMIPDHYFSSDYELL